MSFRKPVLERLRTAVIDKGEIDFKVLEFGCRDGSVLSSLGKHCKNSYWKIAIGSDSNIIEIELNVDKGLVHDVQVGIKANGQMLYPSTGSAPMAGLKYDFKFQWPFRGQLRGIGQKEVYEVRPAYGRDVWFPAVITDQLDGNEFKALVTMPDGRGGVKEVGFPAIRIQNVREAANKAPVRMAERSLNLLVPARDPMHATLTVDDEELVTHFFVRPTPPPEDKVVLQTTSRNSVLMKLSKDRSEVTTDVGHSVFSHFLDGQVRSGSKSSSTLRKSWTVQIGPWAKHTVEFEKKYKASKVHTLTVDGQILAEASAEDVDSPEGWWSCQFRFVGEKYLLWEVNESDGEGRTLESTGIVPQKTVYVHDCVVCIPDSSRDLAEALFHIDALEWSEMPQEREPLQGEAALDLSPLALRGTYGLVPPYKVLDSQQTRGRGGGSGGGLFSCCCAGATSESSEMVVQQDR